MIFLIASLTSARASSSISASKITRTVLGRCMCSEFGGDMEFRPWDTFDGACKKNCAFASGEAASGFWMLAPALLAPPPWRALAIAASIAYGVATSALRVAFGGHFLSDVLIGGLISAIVVVALWRLMFPRAPT